MKRIVISGAGVISPIGNNLEQFHAGLLIGKDGLQENRFHQTDDLQSRRIGQVQGFTMPESVPGTVSKHCSRVDQYALTAALEATDMAGLHWDEKTRNRTGVLLGSGGAVANAELYVYNAVKDRPNKPSQLLTVNPDHAGTVIANHFCLHGPRSSIMTACSSGATAIGFAADLIRFGYADVMITGGCESLSYVTLSGFNALGALASDKTRPFDKNRDGIVLGEGAGIVILESEEHAKARNAPVLAHFCAYGITSDANHITAPHPDGLAKAMRIALKDAALDRGDIQYVNAHGTGTPLNDKAETQALKTVFGDHAYRFCSSSIKPLIGHCLSAAGALEAIATVMALKGQFAPPTINYETPDPDCDLDYVANAGRNLAIEYAMSNSLAFGGNNTSLIFKHAEE